MTTTLRSQWHRLTLSLLQRLLVFGVIAPSLSSACARDVAPVKAHIAPEPAELEPSTAIDGGAPPAAPPESIEPHFTTLEVAAGVSGNQASALIWDPGGRDKKPLLVVTHGAGGGPEWHSAFWAKVVQTHAFVLGVQGRAIADGADAYYYPQHHDLKERLIHLLAAFEQRYHDRLASEHAVYVGYSQGATMGALILPELAASFGRALLIEGGYEQWPVSSAQHFARGGGLRVFFACGTQSCQRGADRSVKWLQKAGLDAQAATAAGAGHTPAGAVGEQAIRGLHWLVHDASAWQSFGQ